MASSPEPASHLLEGRLAIVTGGATGIGFATASELARLGAEVVIASRDAAAGRAAAERINAAAQRQAVHFSVLDLSSFDSVRTFASCWHERDVSLLINNAGVMGAPLRRTPQGFEWHLGVNLVGHFLLSTLLVESLARGTASRVVQVTSGAHIMAPFNFDDPNYERRAFDSQRAYWESKTACALFAVEFQARLARRGIEAFSASPGIVETGLLSSMDDAARKGMLRDRAASVRTPAQAAANSVYAAISTELAGKGGAYIEDCAVVLPSGPDVPGGVALHARDPETAARLWSFAESQVRSALQGARPGARDDPA